MAQPVAVRRRATTLAAVEINGGTMAADEAPPANEEAVVRPDGVAGDEVPAMPPAPVARRRTSTTMAAVEAAGDSLGAPDEALADAPGGSPAPAAEEGDGLDMGDAPGDDVIRGITPFPADADGLPLIPRYAAERIAAGARGEFFVPPSDDGTARAEAAPGDARDADPDAEARDGEGRNPGPEAETDGKGDGEDDEERDDFPDYVGIDPLHGEIMALLLAPRRQLRQQVAEEMDALRVRRGELSAHLGAQMQAAAQPRTAGGSGGRPGLLGAFRRDPVRRLNAEAAGLDRTLLQRRAFGRRVLNSQYRQAADAADAMYRTHAALDREVRDFNVRFAASTKGANFLKALDYVAEHRGIGVDDLRARINDPSDADGTVAKLRARQSKLRADPEFSQQLDRIDKMANLAARHGESFRQKVEMLERNGVDLSGLGDLGEKIEEGMKVERPLLSEPGRDGGMERLQETLKRLADSLKEIVSRILARLRGVGFPF